MGRGTYIGGHTVVGPRWFSHTRRRKRLPTRATQPQLDYLRGVIHAELIGTTIPSIPANLRDEVIDCGGPKKWAQSFPEYESLRAEKIMKLIARGLTPNWVEKHGAAGTEKDRDVSAQQHGQNLLDQLEDLKRRRTDRSRALAEAQKTIKEHISALKDLNEEIARLETLIYKGVSEFAPAMHKRIRQQT